MSFPCPPPKTLAKHAAHELINKSKAAETHDHTVGEGQSGVRLYTFAPAKPCSIPSQHNGRYVTFSKAVIKGHCNINIVNLRQLGSCTYFR